MASTTEFSVIDEDGDAEMAEEGCATAAGGSGSGGGGGGSARCDQRLLTTKSSDNLSYGTNCSINSSGISRLAPHTKLLKVNFTFNPPNLTIGGIQFKC